MKTKTQLILENNSLRIALSRLVNACSNPSFPGESNPHPGVRMPDKLTVEACRKTLEQTAP